MAMLLVVACSGPQFERDDAAKLISETEQAAALGQRVSTYQGYLDDGEAQGLWSTENSREPVMDAPVGEQITGLGTDFVQPAAPVKINITVTGMAKIPSDGTATSAEFDWSYGELPKYIKRFALLGGTGQASFQKFDDGWRVSSVSFSRPDGRTELSSAEMDEVQADTAKETARRNALVERIRASFAQGKLIKSYDVIYYGEPKRYAIFENGVAGYTETNDKFGHGTGKLVQTSFAWFGLMFNLREGGYGVQYSNNPGVEPSQLGFNTTYLKMDTKDFLQTVTAAHAAWTKQYGDLPLILRGRIYYETEAERRKQWM